MGSTRYEFRYIYIHVSFGLAWSKVFHYEFLSLLVHSQYLVFCASFNGTVYRDWDTLSAPVVSIQILFHLALIRSRAEGMSRRMEVRMRKRSKRNSNLLPSYAIIQSTASSCASDTLSPACIIAIALLVGSNPRPLDPHQTTIVVYSRWTI